MVVEEYLHCQRVCANEYEPPWFRMPCVLLAAYSRYGVLRKLKHIFPNTYQRINSICSPAKGGTGCYRFNYQPGS